MPEGWILTHIINLDPGWQVNTKDDEHVVVATGETIEEAIIGASIKIAYGDYNGTLFHVASIRSPEFNFDSPRALLAKLGLTRPSAPIKRRL